MGAIKAQPLHIASLLGRATIARTLLHHHALVAAPAERVQQMLKYIGSSVTPLHVAVMAGHPALVSLLLQHGAVLADRAPRMVTPSCFLVTLFSILTVPGPSLV
eukprot:m.146721 g.146721  ORF g.146721 m.146721 type:complete len:104 (-) comp15038_c0_seq3:565-876(-)